MFVWLLMDHLNAEYSQQTGPSSGTRTQRLEYASAPLSWRKLSLLSSHNATLTGNELVCSGPPLALSALHVLH